MALVIPFCSGYGFSVDFEISGFDLFCFACMPMGLFHYLGLITLQIPLKKRKFFMTIDFHYMKLPDSLRL